MWTSTWDGRARAPLRIGIATVMALSQAMEAFSVAQQSLDPLRYPPSGPLSQLLVGVPGAAWMLYSTIALGLWAVACDRRPVLGAVWALAWSAVLSQWQTEIFGSPSRNAFFPGAVLLGWTLGQVWAGSLCARPKRSLREQLGESGALGCLAAAYVGSALSKLSTTGLRWADGAQVRALILQQQPLLPWAWLAELRWAIVETPGLAEAVSTATLLIEGGAFLLLFGSRLRAVWGVLLLLLHTSIALLNSMPYVGASLLVLLLCLPWRGQARPCRDAHGTVPWNMVVLLACLIVAAWALEPLGWRATS